MIGVNFLIWGNLAIETKLMVDREQELTNYPAITITHKTPPAEQNQGKTAVKAEIQTKAPLKPITAQESQIREKACPKFGEDCDVMIAIAKSESGLRSNAQGYNCRYTNAKGKLVSQACKPGDESKAWSVDCGLWQINVPGAKTCPAELFNPEVNIARANGKLQSKLGLGHWVNYKNGHYKQKM